VDWKKDISYEYYVRALGKFKAKLEELTGTVIDDEKLLPQIRLQNRINSLSALREFAKDNYIQIGISNAFTQTRDIAAHYDQAKRALSFAKRIKTDDKIFFFSDYIFYVLFDQMDDNNIFSYVRHPALDILAAFDAEKGSDLYNTLKVYAQAGFNKIKAAELLFLHRNTVNYRIQQIENLCNIDLSNTDLLFPLQLSLIIDSYLNNEPIN
jgi:purine catabolism regulator